MKREYYLAIDIGASSGRHIVGYEDENEIKTVEVYRFNNGVLEENGHLIWDVNYLFEEVKKGIKVALQNYNIKSLSIDTWGVDYVLLNNDKVVYPVYAYRDCRTKEIINEVHTLISFEELYKKTGTQFQTFNSVYQFYYDLKHGRLNNATDYLMIPEYLIYRLTGVKVNEFTNATTTGMINCETLSFDEEIIQKLSLPRNLFKKLVQPKYMVGQLMDNIQQEVKGNINVVLCATHDTASAVEGIKMTKNEPYISSGTWSLLGVKTRKPITDINSLKANFSNEGGINYNRYQKNIMGMWLINELKKELCNYKNITEIVSMAKESNFEEFVDVNSDIFLSPNSMKGAFDVLLRKKPKNEADYFKCAYKSLAISYKKTIEELENNTNNKYDSIYIVGGGAKNDFLNELTEVYTKKKVIALPIEATAIGNLKVQMEAK